MTRYVQLEGADRPFAPEIVDALSAHDLEVVSCIGEPPGALIINRATAFTPTAFEAVTDDAFDAAIGDSLLSVFDLIQVWAPRLTDGAAIVVLTSRAYLGAWGAAPEAAASAALAGFCRTLALELAPRGIRVNLAAADFAEAYGSDPAGRARIADAVAWLASDRSGAISGQVLLLDQGRGLQMREAPRRNLSAS